ncbi:hypothetical protein GJAV_G00084580 [Gymnothorax javanicus]|nr:hypothetical protein GJAV_G00084580 [Gymnothorax javanicus]
MKDSFAHSLVQRCARDTAEFREKRLDSTDGLLRGQLPTRDWDAGGSWRRSRELTSVGCTRARVFPRRGGTRRMPCGAPQSAENRKLDSHFLFTLLATLLCLVHPGEGFFMSGSKAVFARSCDDHWTLADPQRIPQLIQMTLCVDVRPLHVRADWVAFTYSLPNTTQYSLALQGGPSGLYVWLLGVRHHFRTHLAPRHWHHVCLRYDADSHTLTLEVDREAFELTVKTQAIPPAGKLVLGCRGWDAAQRRRAMGGVELYLFRIWDDVQEHSACEDGSVVSWDSLDWHVFGISRVSDDTLRCGHKRARREAVSPVAGQQSFSLHPASAGSPHSNTSSPVKSVPAIVTPPEPQVVQCSFSEFCAMRTAYYWMSISLETQRKMSESEITAWLSQVFNISMCNPSLDIANMQLPLTIINNTLFDRDQNGCTTEAEKTVYLLQDLEVNCNTKEDIRVANCTVLLQLSQPTDPCILRQVLEVGSPDTTIKARVLGDVERVGKGLCQNEDMLSPDAGFVRCASSSTPLSEACSSGESVNVTCTHMETAYIAMETLQPISQLCTQRQEQFCDCTNFCRDTAAYYVLQLDILSASISIAHIRTVISQLSSTQPCQSSPNICPIFQLVSPIYQGAHLECRGTEERLFNCMVVLKLSQTVDMCLASTVILFLLQEVEDIDFNGAVTRAAICSWPSEPEADLLNSTFTWVSADLFASEICHSLNPVVFACKEDEILGVLLKESCTPPTPPSAATSSPLTITNSKTTKTSTTANSTSPAVIPPVLPTEAPTADSTTGAASTQFTTVTMTTPSEEDMAERLEEQTKEAHALNSTEVEQVVSQLEDLLSAPNISRALGQRLLTIASNLLNASSDTLATYSRRIINTVEELGQKLVVQDGTETITSDSLTLAVKTVDGANFEETVFSIANPDNAQISIRDALRAQRRTRNARASALGTITLPASLTDSLTEAEQLLASRVQFIYYERTTLFQDKSLVNGSINSGVLATSVANLSISGLKDNVSFTLQNIQPIPGNFVAICVFWDFNQNDGLGGWSSEGCSVQNSTDSETICSCNHLTSFAVLLDLSREGITDRLHAIIQTFITFIGCGISAIFLSITLLTYLFFEKLRRDIPSKILMQLCTALLLLNLTFLLDSWLALYTEAVGLCISTAFFLHYFLLVSFTWMGLEAFHMYLAIVKVFNTYMSRYMLKFSLFGWGVPLIVVIIVIAINKDNYGLLSYGKYDDGSSDEFCWIRNDIAFYVAVVAYFCLVFVVNLAMFVVVMVQLRRIKRQNPHGTQHRNGLQDLRSVAGLTFLLGLTWGFAFFAWGPVNLAFMYIFAILNSLQGFFIFVFHCALKDNVRRQWRAYLCCGKLRLTESSEWSRTTTNANNYKDSVYTGTSSQIRPNLSSSSTSVRTNDSGEASSSPTSEISEDSVFTAARPPIADVVANSRRNTLRP